MAQTGPTLDECREALNLAIFHGYHRQDTEADHVGDEVRGVWLGMDIAEEIALILERMG